MQKDKIIKIQDKALQRITTNSLIFMLVVLCVSGLATKYSRMISYATMKVLEGNFSEENIAKQEIINKDVLEELGSRYIQIEKGTAELLETKIEDLYLENIVQLRIKGLSNKTISKDCVSWVNQGNVYWGKQKTRNSKKDIVKKINLSYQYQKETNTYEAILNLALNHIYAYTLYEDNEYFYINLENVHDVYDKIIVVDAGHGGSAVGSYPISKICFEKNLNLQIVLYLKELLDKEDIKVYYTRLNDENIYLRPRVNLANELDADLFVSVHCNSDDTRTAYGTEVLYGANIKKMGINSKQLAKICQDELVDIINTRDRGICERKDVYILKQAKVPAVLVEVAFLSHYNDLQFLLNKQNQKQAAKGIYNGIIKALDEMESYGKRTYIRNNK